MNYKLKSGSRVALLALWVLILGACTAGPVNHVADDFQVTMMNIL